MKMNKVFHSLDRLGKCLMDFYSKLESVVLTAILLMLSSIVLLLMILKSYILSISTSDNQCKNFGIMKLTNFILIVFLLWVIWLYRQFVIVAVFLTIVVRYFLREME